MGVFNIGTLLHHTEVRNCQPAAIDLVAWTWAITRLKALRLSPLLFPDRLDGFLLHRCVSRWDEGSRDRTHGDRGVISSDMDVEPLMETGNIRHWSLRKATPPPATSNFNRTGHYASRPKDRVSIKRGIASPKAGSTGKKKITKSSLAAKPP